MTPFRTRAVGTAHLLGERLRQVRQDAQLTLEAVAQQTGINVKHLRAIEEGRYGDLPGAVYARSFVRAYAQALEIREDSALRLLEREYAVAAKLRPTAAAVLGAGGRPRELLTPQRLRRAGVVLLAVGVLVYLGLEIRNLNAPPSLNIHSPPDQLTTTERTVELVGTTEPETIVTANGSPIVVDRDGRFHDVLDLQAGLNTVIIRAQRKRGRATTVVRQILVQSAD
ncbi:MAG: helix-turn-helix domain-containing protein [Candidatus Kerfeldbacteria bacterium]|nr:helix-turn-helix domain-containing protein [Candidatus Kerfeldbacteria bacterium]